MNIYILIPSFVPSGPVKGALALANFVCKYNKTFLVVLRDEGKKDFHEISTELEVILLYNKGNKFLQFKKMREIYDQNHHEDVSVSISSCFSADLFNLISSKKVITISSVRGNLPYNYKAEYGFPGSVLAFMHLAMLRFFDQVIVMNSSMLSQVSKFMPQSPEVIPNFIDEQNMEKYRADSVKKRTTNFIFVGSLTSRKKPDIILNSLKEIVDKGLDVNLDIIGEGPLLKSLEEKIENLKVSAFVSLHGHLNDFYKMVSSADVFILPSMSEGISRACLESLFLGTKVILRNVDGNEDLIEEGINGYLFNDDKELTNTMLRSITEKRDLNDSILPEKYRQDSACSQHLKLFKKVYERTSRVF